MKKILKSILVAFSLFALPAIAWASVLGIQQGGTALQYPLTGFQSGTCLTGNGLGAIGTTTCGTGSGSFPWPWTPSTNFAVPVQATTGIVWYQNGLQASSTSKFDTLSVGGAATSTFTGGIDAAKVCITGTTKCLNGTAASSTILSDNNTWTGLNQFGNNHFSVGGITATGATGNGKVVFDNLPTLTTPTVNNMYFLPSGTASEQFYFYGKGGATIPVPFFYPNTTNTALAFDISPNGAPGNKFGIGPSWIDLLSTDVNNANYEALRFSKRDAGPVYITSAQGGTGLYRDMTLQYDYSSTTNSIAGNVGIATGTPSANFRLSVAGNGQFAGNIAAASITATGTLTLSALTGTQCLHEVSGVVSGTGSDCGSGGGTNFLTNSGSNTYLNTGSNLQAPSFQATSTATSTFVGPVYVSTTGSQTGVPVYLRVGSTTVPGYVPNYLADFIDSKNDFLSANVWNTSNGSCATADLTVNNDTGNLTMNFGDLGHTSSSFTGSGCSNNPFTGFGYNSTYLYDPTGWMDFAIGSTSLNTSFNWFAGGYTNANKIMVLTNGGRLGIGTSTPNNALSVQGNAIISGDIISAGNITATGTLKLSALLTGCLTNTSGTVSSTGATCGTGTVGNGVTGQLAFYNSNGTSIVGSSSDSVTIGRVNATSTIASNFLYASTSQLTISGIGMTRLVVSSTTVNPPMTANGPFNNGSPVGNIISLAEGAAGNQLIVANFGQGAAGVNTFSAGGSLSNPSATQSGIDLYFMGGRGFGSSVWNTSSKAAIREQAAATFTDTSNPTRISFEVTPVNSITRAQAMLLDSTGFLGIGSSTPSAKLAVQTNSSTVRAEAISTTTSRYVRWTDSSGNNYYGGDTPTLSSCGTTQRLFPGSNNNAGRFQVGSDALQVTCTLTFADGGFVDSPNGSAPACDVNIEGGLTIFAAASTTQTTMLVTAAATFASDFVSYQCHGY